MEKLNIDMEKEFGGSKGDMKAFGFSGSVKGGKRETLRLKGMEPSAPRAVETREPASKQAEPINRPNRDARYVRTTLADLPGPEQAYGVQPSRRTQKPPPSY